jgi:hypothetical protein
MNPGDRVEDIMQNSDTESSSAQKKKVMAEIRRLHRRHEPMNLSAVKREHPELLEVVFAVRPFWGWKRALEDAGIRYSDIRVELSDRLVCEICGREKAHLANHLLLAHQVEPEDYRIDYPEAEMSSEELRARRSWMSSRSLPHWEPIWSREYVMDRVAEYQRRGAPLHSAWLQRKDTALFRAMDRYLDGWAKALRAMGIDPKEATREAYVRLRRYPEPRAVIREIRRRDRQGYPINSAGVRNGDPTIRRRKRRFDAALWHAAHLFFGSWHRALEAAGFDPLKVHAEILNPGRYPDRKSVIQELLRRQAEGLPLAARHVITEGTRDSALVVSARQQFGSWLTALKAAGIPRPKRRFSLTGPIPRYRDADAVRRGIRARRRAGLPLNNAAVSKGALRDLPLMNKAYEFFGSWPDALRAAGLDPDAIRLHPGPRRKPGRAVAAVR